MALRASTTGVAMKQAPKGFTLVEVMVALVLFSIVSLAIASQLVFPTAMISENAQYSQAIALAQQALEDLRAVPYDSIDDGLETVTWKGIPFTVSWDVEEGEGTKEIQVTVSWESKGETKTYGIQSIFADVR